jgi:hypothetical protein
MPDRNPTLEFFGPLESPLQELTTVDGTSIWAGEGVHLPSNATRVAAMKMMACIIGGETAEPANKRARLESVIPVRSIPLPAVKPVQPAPPPANQSGNSHPRGQQRGGRGGQNPRGGQTGSVRMAPPPPRGGAIEAGPEAAAQAAGAAGRKN